MYALKEQEFGGLTDTLVNVFTQAGNLATSYYAQLAAINKAKADAEAAKLGSAASQAANAANQSVANITQYMPYLIGAIALVAVAGMIRK